LSKTIKRVIIGLIVLSSLYGIARLIDVAYGSYQFVPREPYMVMQTQNSINIKWQTPQNEIGKVAYGLHPNNLNHVLMENLSSKSHSIIIPKLQECTKYFYSVSSSSLKIDNEGRSFSTLCKHKDTQRVWIIGDSGKKSRKQKMVYEQMLKYINNDFNNLDMWILLGDNAYKNGTQKQYNKNLFEPYKELVKRFTPWAVIGNHDARRWAFYNIWDFPTNGESGGLASKHKEFYSIDDGNLHLVMLDSQTISRDKNSDMAKWLKEDLKQNTKPWVVVAFHTPPYTNGSHNSDNYFDSLGRMKEMRENFVPIFDEFGVDLVLSGHSHGYERSKLITNHTGKSNSFSEKNIVQNKKDNYTKDIKKEKNSGTIYLVSGCASKLSHNAPYGHPALPYSFKEMGSVILEITKDTLTSKFLTINGKITDQFTITKKE
jgi:predicted phosphodiesterase